MKNIILLLALSLLGACNKNKESVEAEAVFRINETRLKPAFFSLKLPPDWKLTRLSGVDSYIGYFQNGTDTLWFDYSFLRGGEANPITPFIKTLSVEETEINNSKAWIVKEARVEGIRLSAYIYNTEKKSETRLFTFNPKDDQKFIELFKTHRFTEE